MRFILFFLLSISISANAQRGRRPRTIPNTIYYVSTSGSSSNTGVTPSSPIDAATLLTKPVKARDQINFKAGQSFEIADWSLNSVDGLNFSIYGTGGNANIYGSTDVGGNSWTNEGSGIYSTACATPLWVYMNKAPGKWAESDWVDISAVTANSITADLDALNPIGATAVFRERSYRFSQKYTITAYNTTTNEATLDRVHAVITDGKIKLFGKSDYVNENGEWYYSSGRLYVKAASSPAGTDIRIGTSTTGLTLLKSSNVTIDSLNFQNHQDRAIRTVSCDNFTLTNSGIKNNRLHGAVLDFQSTGNTISGNTFYNNGFTGLLLCITQSTSITNNTFGRTGMNITIPFTVVGDPGIVSNGGGAVATYAFTYMPNSNYNWPVSLTIQNNVIDSSASAGIALVGLDPTITKNQISNFSLRLDDDGGIYVFGRRGSYYASRRGIITNNIVWNGIGSADGFDLPVAHVVGIYIDNGSDLYEVRDNTVYQITTLGIVNNWNNKSNLFTGNNIMDCLYGFGTRDANTVALSPDYLFNVGNTFSNNVMACRSTAQRCMDLQQWDGLTTWVPFSSGGAADNNIYIQPYTTNINYYRTAINGTGADLTQYTLATWKTKLGKDASSTSQTNYITYSNGTNAAQEVKIQVNATNSSAGFTLPAGYKQPDGTVGGSVTIPAWGSFIYLKQTAFP